MTKDVPDGYQPFPELGGFVRVCGPYYYKPPDGAASPSVFRYGFRAGPAHLNPNGVVHGGALMTFADTVMGAAVYYLAKRPCATISMNSEFLAGAPPDSWIEAAVTVTRQTNSLTFARCELDADGTILLTSSGIWKLFQPKIPGHEKPSY